MREIKFRAFNIVTKKMLDLHTATPLALAEPSMKGVFLPFYDYIKLMQYTGLKDKNGKEIYEGDIVKPRRSYHPIVHPIVIEYMKLENCGDCFDDSGTGIGFNLYLNQPENLQVIGNIYENPELLNNENTG